MWQIAISLASILLSSLLFINAVERLGEKLGLTRFAVGAVLIALLTAMPETSIALVSPWIGSDEALEVGQAAVLGAPSITILLGVPLVTLLSKSDVKKLPRGIAVNYRIFGALFPIVALVGFTTSGLKFYAGFVLVALGSYLSYLNSRVEGRRFEADEQLYFSRFIRYENLAVLMQLLLGLVGMLYSADFLIDSLSVFSNPFFYAVVLTPFGTCLQEVVAATILAARGKGDVGLAVLAGENMIQATIVSGIGMLATPWTLSYTAVLIALTFSATGITYSLFAKTTRFLGPLVYLAYVVLASL